MNSPTEVTEPKPPTSGRIARLCGRISDSETSGRFAFSLLPADFVVCNLVLFAFYSCFLSRPFDAEQSALIAAGVVVCNLAGFTYGRRHSGAAWIGWVRVFAAGVSAVVLLPLVARLDGGLDAASIRTAVALCLPPIALLRIVHRRTAVAAPHEALRGTVIAAGGLAAGFPFLTGVTVGTGDAYWYGNMVGDFVQQWRAGVFPVFVGQSDYALNGAITPLRYAPYLQHAAGVLDLVTFRSLTNAGLVNLVVFLSIVGAAFTAYFCLAAVTTANRWIACLLAVLFVLSPAVLSLAYTGDLFMSVCALPFLPLVFHGIWRTFRDHDFRSVCALTIPLAAAWLCHPPIAFWAGVIAAISQIVRLAGRARDSRAWGAALGGAGVFFALTAGAFVSVFTLGVPSLIADPPTIVNALLEASPGAFLPVSENAGAPGDYQLGWSLWSILLAGMIAAIAKPRGFPVALTAGCALLLALVLPIGPVLNFFWLKVLPQTVANITFTWPMQRFYILLATMAVFLGAIAFGRLARTRAWINLPVIGLLGLGIFWSVQEAVPFLRRGQNNTEPLARFRVAQLPENRVLTRYAYSPFAVVPPYFSHGYVDGNWENRLLDINSGQETDSNYRFVTGPNSTVVDSGEITAQIDAPGARSYVLLRNLPLKARQHYALEFEFNHPAIAGTLLAEGPTLARNYLLPNSGVGITTTGAPTSFGALPSSKKSIPFFVSSVEESRIDTVQFWANAPLGQDISRFGRYHLRSYDPEKMPVVVMGWTPFQARVTAGRPAWLETPRMHLDGYRARVNDAETPVRKSPAGLVMVSVPAGVSSVTLDYPGPAILRFAYYFSLSAWIGVFLLGLRRPRKQNSSSEPA